MYSSFDPSSWSSNNFSSNSYSSTIVPSSTTSSHRYDSANSSFGSKSSFDSLYSSPSSNHLARTRFLPSESATSSRRSPPSRLQDSYPDTSVSSRSPLQRQNATRRSLNLISSNRPSQRLSSTFDQNSDPPTSSRRSSINLPTQKLSFSDFAGLSERSTYGADRFNPRGIREVSPIVGSASSSSTGNNPSDQISLQEQDFFNRLVAAHTRVDELLRSRGIAVENEPKHQRIWESHQTTASTLSPLALHRQVERRSYARAVSNSDSDSGLSMDHEQDNQIKEQKEDEEEDISEEVEKFFDEDEGICELVMPIACTFANISLTCQATSDDVNTQVFVNFEQSCQQLSELVSITLPLVSNKNKNIVRLQKTLKTFVPFNTPIECCECSFTLPEQNVRISHTFLQARLAGTSNNFEIAESDSSRQSSLKRKEMSRIISSVEQKLILARRKTRDRQVHPTAEISIQHCSFYQVAKSINPEKCVRMNLRLTERTPKNYNVVISLPAPPRTILVRLDIQIPTDMTTSIASRSSASKSKRHIGKLNHTFGVEAECQLSDTPKEQRKINRLKIPESFLNVSDGDLAPAIIGGFLYEAKEKVVDSVRNLKNRRESRMSPSDFSSDSLTKTISKSAMTYRQLKERNANDQLISVSGLGLPEENLNSTSEAESSDHSSACLPAPSDRACTADSGFKTDNGSPGMSDLSSLKQPVVHQTLCNDVQSEDYFNNNKVLDCLNNCSNSGQTTKRSKRRNTCPVLSGQSSTSELFLPELHQHPISADNDFEYVDDLKESLIQPKLRRVYHNIRRFSKRIHILDLPVTLKKVDHSIVRPKISISNQPKWIPSWRKTSCDTQMFKRESEPLIVEEKKKVESCDLNLEMNSIE